MPCVAAMAVTGKETERWNASAAIIFPTAPLDGTAYTLYNLACIHRL